MYVRWQKYRSQARGERQRQRKDECARLKAVLVESVRVDGKPRQRHIAFLASLETGRDRRKDLAKDAKDARYFEHCTRMELSGRARFWITVGEVLDRLDNRIAPEDRARIEASIAERVARPSPEQIQAWLQGREALLASLR
jgi:hypothetical protein